MLKILTKYMVMMVKTQPALPPQNREQFWEDRSKNIESRTQHPGFYDFIASFLIIFQLVPLTCLLFPISPKIFKNLSSVLNFLLLLSHLLLFSSHLYLFSKCDKC